MNASERHFAAAQTRLPLERVPDFGRDSFIVSPGNAEAFAAIDAWPRWPGGTLVLVGPAHSGKSHLAAIWAKAAGAAVFGPLDHTLPSDHAPIALEDADRRAADEAMFHLMNVADLGASVLMTARRPPREWTSTLPDMRSRLNAIHVVELATPDDAVLSGLLNKFFRERNIRPEADVIPYLVRRIERSSAAAFDAVAHIDEASDAERRGVTRAFARDVLDRLRSAHDLFD